MATTNRVGIHAVADASANAALAARLVEAGEGLDAGWRYGVLQTVDDYLSDLRRGGIELAEKVFDAEPAPTGARELDAAFAALADYFASRDGWTVPAWALDPQRTVERWYPSVPGIFRAEADRESPPAFLERGIRITARSLLRA
ncbi:MAG: hypothetical protein KF727_14355 [Microbacteriaceae bacterium]|nr:hypothetical protein [Microbacteriaceae bacterium]